MPDSSIMLELCKILGISVNELLNGEIADMENYEKRQMKWSLIPFCSIVFAWVVFIPSIMWGKRGIVISLLSLSVFIVPYFWLLGILIKLRSLLTIGAAMAFISILFLWMIVAVFYRMWKTRKFIAFSSGLLYLGLR